MVLFTIYHKEQSILQMHVYAMELTPQQENNGHHKRSAQCAMPAPSTQAVLSVPFHDPGHYYPHDNDPI